MNNTSVFLEEKEKTTNQDPPRELLRKYKSDKEVITSLRNTFINDKKDYNTCISELKKQLSKERVGDFLIAYLKQSYSSELGKIKGYSIVFHLSSDIYMSLRDDKFRELLTIGGELYTDAVIKEGRRIFETNKISSDKLYNIIYRGIQNTDRPLGYLYQYKKMDGKSAIFTDKQITELLRKFLSRKDEINYIEIGEYLKDIGDEAYPLLLNDLINAKEGERISKADLLINNRADYNFLSPDLYYNLLKQAVNISPQTYFLGIGADSTSVLTLQQQNELIKIAAFGTAKTDAYLVISSKLNFDFLSEEGKKYEDLINLSFEQIRKKGIHLNSYSREIDNLDGEMKYRLIENFRVAGEISELLLLYATCGEGLFSVSDIDMQKVISIKEKKGIIDALITIPKISLAHKLDEQGNESKKEIGLKRPINLNIYAGILRQYVSMYGLPKAGCDFTEAIVQYQKNIAEFIKKGVEYAVPHPIDGTQESNEVKKRNVHTFFISASMGGGDDYGPLDTNLVGMKSIYKSISGDGQFYDYTSDACDCSFDEILERIKSIAEAELTKDDKIIIYFGLHGGKDGSAFYDGHEITIQQFDQLFNVQVSNPDRLLIMGSSCNSGTKDQDFMNNTIKNVYLDSKKQSSLSDADAVFVQAFQSKTATDTLSADFDDDGMVNINEAIFYRNLNYDYSLTHTTYSDSSGKVIEI